MNDQQTLQISWSTSVLVHTQRFVTRWLRSPVAVIATLAMPVMILVVIHVMFSRMVEQFSGAPMDMTTVCVMIAVAQAFAAALMGAGGIVQERHDGMPDRLATLPGSRSTALVARIIAESAISFLSMVVAVAVGLAYGADFRTFTGLFGTLIVLAVVSVSVGSVGVMLGFVVDTPQGAVSLAPLVMAAMFFNTAMMPRDMYARVLRPVVDVSPLTAIDSLTQFLVNGQLRAGDVVLFTAWFGGLFVLSLVVLVRKTGRARG